MLAPLNTVYAYVEYKVHIFHVFSTSSIYMARERFVVGEQLHTRHATLNLPILFTIFCVHNISLDVLDSAKLLGFEVKAWGAGNDIAAMNATSHMSRLKV